MTPTPDFNRLRLAVMGGQPDRVPLAEITIDEGAKEAFLGKQVNDLATDVEFYLAAGYDFMTLGRRLAGFPPIWDAARLETYYEVQRQVGRGHSAGVIRDWDDFKAYPWMRPADLDFRILDRVEKHLPAQMKVVRYMGPVFQMAWMLMGFETFCYKVAQDPDLIVAIMDKIFDLVQHELEDALARECVGAVWYGDDIAMKGRLMVSPDFLRQHFFPRLRTIGEACRRRGVPLLYHTDGDVNMVVEDIIGAGVHALHPIDPTSMDIFEFKPRVAGRLAVIGNIDVTLLTKGTPREVEAATLDHLLRLAPGGGYVMGSSNSIHRQMQPENYRAMLDATLRYGRYPITLTS